MSSLYDRMITCPCHYLISSILTTVLQHSLGSVKPHSREIMASGYTYDCSGHTVGYHAQGVAVVVSNNLIPMIIEVTTVNEHIMRLRIRHSLGVVSLIFVCAPTEASDITVKDAFYATLNSVVNGCPR